MSVVFPTSELKPLIAIIAGRFIDVSVVQSVAAGTDTQLNCVGSF